MRRFELVERAENALAVRELLGTKSLKELHNPDYIFITPRRQTQKSAGYDFYSPSDYTIEPGDVVHILTGYKVYMQDDEFLMIAIRSSLGYVGLELINHLGIIDADYVDNETNEGEISFRIRNNSKFVYNIKQGERMGQGVFLKYGITVDDAPANKVRTGPSGSTGK